jgi:hypothetical protein
MQKLQTATAGVRKHTRSAQALVAGPLQSQHTTTHMICEADSNRRSAQAHAQCACSCSGQLQVQHNSANARSTAATGMRQLACSAQALVDGPLQVQRNNTHCVWDLYLRSCTDATSGAKVRMCILSSLADVDNMHCCYVYRARQHSLLTCTSATSS